MKKRWMLIVAGVLGIAAVFLVNVYIKGQKPPDEKQGRVVVAVRDITKGQVVGHSSVNYKTMPLKFIQPGALKSRESAVGKTAVTTIMTGEQVLSNKLTSPGRGLTLSAKTPPGKRAFSIGLDSSSAVGGMILPGDHVDVLAIFSAPPTTITLFQDILILAVGGNMVALQDGKEIKKSASAARKEGVTMALSPQQVQILSVAMEQGKIKLTLRPRAETGAAMPSVDLSQLPPAVNLNTLLQFYFRQPEPVPQVEVIRGLKKEISPIPAK